MRTATNDIRFPHKPSQAVRDALKGYGFRWHRSGVWYAPQSIASAAVCGFFGPSPNPDADLTGLHECVGDCQMEAECGII